MAHQVGPYPDSVAGGTRSISTPPGWDASITGLPPALSAPIIIYTVRWRKQLSACLVQEHNAMSLARGGVLTKINTARLRPRSDPLPFSVPFSWQKRYPFRIPSIFKWYPFREGHNGVVTFTANG